MVILFIRAKLESRGWSIVLVDKLAILSTTFIPIISLLNRFSSYQIILLIDKVARRIRRIR